MATNTAEIRVGRLLEVRVAMGYRTVEDVDQLFDALEVAVGRLPEGVQHVTVADWTRCAVMTPLATTRLRERMSRTNGRTERSAVLVISDAPIAVVQFLRVIREANLPDRRLFFSASELVNWLSATLTVPESERLQQFLTELPAPARVR
jgi:hypothetical protein